MFYYTCTAMIKINNIPVINSSKSQQKQSFKGEEGTITKPQVEKLPDVKPDYAVKTPMPYTKTGEMNFPYDTKAYCYKLANGQKVIIVPQEGETVLRTYVNSGSMNEPDNLRGISHYIEHNLFNGSEGLEEGEFFKAVDKMGASTNASTGFAETNYYISSNLLNDADLENKIRLHASMLETPIFAIDKLEKEKGIVNSEINMILSKPENLAINKTLKNLYGIKSTSTDLIGGTTDNITNLTREDVVNYYNNNYFPANMVTVITGDVKPDETIQLISKYFTSKRQPNKARHFEPLIPTDKTVREDIISNKAVGTTIVVGFNGPKSNDTREKIYISALSRLLSMSPTSRIDKNIKKYNAGSWIEKEKISTNPKDGTVVMLISECVDENSEDILKTIFTEIANIANNPPTDDEMQIIKKKMLYSYSNTFEKSFATNNLIGTSILENNEDYINSFEQIVKSMTAEDLVNTAKKYLDINKASVTVVHPDTVSAETIQNNYKKVSNVSFTGAKKEAINLSEVKEYNMANNYKVVTSNSKTDNVTAIFQMYTDSYYPAKPSVSIILDGLLSEGSAFRNEEELETDLAKNGISVSIGANADNLSGAFICQKEDLDKAMKSFKEVLENPRFTQESFEQVKKRIKDNILTSEKSAFDKLDKEIYKGLPHGISKEDILKDLETVTLDDVKAFYSYLIQNGKAQLGISAPFEKDKSLSNIVFSNTASLRPVKPFEHVTKTIFNPVEETKVLTDVDNKNQAEIIEAFKYKINDNLKDNVTINLMNIILGGNPSSRLFSDLRENQKLAYHVRSNFENNEDTGVFVLKIETTTENSDTGEKSFDNVQKSINGFNKHIAKIKSEKVSEEELNNAKLNLKNQILNSCHSADDKLTLLYQGIDSPYGISRENQMYDMIDSITADDIYNAANYIFAGKPVYSIVATENTLKHNQEFLNSLKA